MAKAKKFDLETDAPIVDEEDEEALAPSTKAFGMPMLAESCLRRRSANFCPSGLPPLLHAKSAERSRRNHG
jgi:hypothetical protein